MVWLHQPNLQWRHHKFVAHERLRESSVCELVGQRSCEMILTHFR